MDGDLKLSEIMQCVWGHAGSRRRPSSFREHHSLCSRSSAGHMRAVEGTQFLTSLSRLAEASTLQKKDLKDST